MQKHKYIEPGAQIKNTLRRFFKVDHPFRDALPFEEFMIHVTQRNWLKGRRGVPTECALVMGIRRQLGLQARDPGAAVLHSIAYVALGCPDSPTGWEVLRFYVERGSVTRGKRRSHTQWDEGKKQKSMCIRLRAPSKSRTLDGRREANRLKKLKAATESVRRLTEHQPPTVMFHNLPRGYEKWWKSVRV
jgi:hypothetical protein